MLDYVQTENQAQSIHQLKGAGDSLEKSSPFFAWRPIFLQIFGLHKTKQMPVDQKMKEILSKLNADWLEYGKSYSKYPNIAASLLNGILDIDFAKTTATSLLSPEECRSVTLDMLIDILQDELEKHSRMVLIIDSCQVPWN
jgi:hypothetical protein